jgi:site-specific DNA-cytosine methylase
MGGRMMKVLIACEFSGTVRDAFIAKGCDAMSCDLLPTENDGPHYQGDVRDILGDGWDLMVAHPPCTHLAVSGAKWFSKKQRQQAEALDFVRLLMDCQVPRWCIENPVSVISTKIRKPDQIIQPWQFGHEATKTTCLWLNGLPKLTPTKIVGKGEFVTFASGNRMAKWYADAARLSPLQRAKVRSQTFDGIANAMADQWSGVDA